MNFPRLQWLDNVRKHDRELSAADVNVACELMLHANTRGQCWPSQQRMGERCRLHRNTVSKSVKKLVERGHVKMESYADGARHYTLLVKTFDALPECTPHSESERMPNGSADHMHSESERMHTESERMHSVSEPMHSESAQTTQEPPKNHPTLKESFLSKPTLVDVEKSGSKNKKSITDRCNNSPENLALLGLPQVLAKLDRQTSPLDTVTFEKQFEEHTDRRLYLEKNNRKWTQAAVVCLYTPQQTLIVAIQKCSYAPADSNPWTWFLGTSGRAGALERAITGQDERKQSHTSTRRHRVENDPEYTF